MVLRKDTATKSISFDNNLLVFPTTLFCSCKKVLIFNFLAAFNTGYVTYPPKPKTISGLNSFNNFKHL